MSSWRERLQTLINGKTEPKDERQSLALAEMENNLLVGASSWNKAERDRDVWDRQCVLEESLNAWRFNPLARRIVELTTQYAVGGGLKAICAESGTQTFLEQFWNHRLNRMDSRVNELSDELCLSGNGRFGN